MCMANQKKKLLRNEKSSQGLKFGIIYGMGNRAFAQTANIS